MKVLGIDTSSDVCGVSIVENETTICSIDLNTGHTHSENLMPSIAKAFEDSNLSLKDIDLIACDIGPGSFTGIRIGIATAKAFVDSLDIPCVGINSLEVLAYKSKHQKLNNIETICSIIDCKNDNCYFAIYESRNNEINCIFEPTASTVEDMLNTLTSFNNVLFIGDGAVAYKTIIQNSLPNATFSDDNEISSYDLCISGLTHYLAFGKTSLLPLYLKKPQAERQFEEKQKGEIN